MRRFACSWLVAVARHALCCRIRRGLLAILQCTQLHFVAQPCPAGIFTGLAITLHNLPEGLATFVGALNDTKVGASIAAAIAIHNVSWTCSCEPVVRCNTAHHAGCAIAASGNVPLLLLGWVHRWLGCDRWRRQHLLQLRLTFRPLCPCVYCLADPRGHLCGDADLRCHRQQMEGGRCCSAHRTLPPCVYLSAMECPQLVGTHASSGCLRVAERPWVQTPVCVGLPCRRAFCGAA